jgi:hypothetical protein
LTIVGFGQQFFARPEQIALRQIMHARQPAQSGHVGLNVAISVDMRDIQTERHKMPRNQDRAMTFHRFFFCAHKGNPKILSHSTEHALKPASKQLGFCKSRVPYFPAFVASRIVATCAEFLAQETIFDSVSARLVPNLPG